MIKNISLLKNKNQMKLMMIKNVAEMYNRTLYAYTRDFKGKLPVPKTDVSKIPKKFMSINEYVESKTQWKQIINFIENSEDLDLNDYFNIIVKNWNTIALSFNMKQKTPLTGIVFSPKMINYYRSLKQKEEQSKVINQHLSVKFDDDFYLLQPSFQSNINSLFRLKKLNSDMLFHEILDVFPGEFEQEFVEIVKQMDESSITQENVINKLKSKVIK